ncbi:hypothetical protein [Streptosporangium roseum]|uniref:hypothetical protein n=1 Tax=Streptosporangium roseum TaxID=2001 RepID=UPI003326DC1D
MRDGVGDEFGGFRSLVLMGLLSALFGPGWRWTWKAAVGIDVISALEYGYGTFVIFGVTSIIAVGFALAVFLLFLLFRPETTRWFKR